nr:hypothetical protein Iba_scaffold13492CG0160 [Ipomoea batatas]
MGSVGDATRRDDGGARLPVVASSLLLSFFKATPLADGEAAGDTAKGEDGGRCGIMVRTTTTGTFLQAASSRG